MLLQWWTRGLCFEKVIISRVDAMDFAGVTAEHLGLVVNGVILAFSHIKCHANYHVIVLILYRGITLIVMLDVHCFEYWKKISEHIFFATSCTLKGT